MVDDQGFEGVPLEVLAETENFAVLLGEDAEGEAIYNVNLGSITLHLLQEEWDELVELMNKAAHK